MHFIAIGFQSNAIRSLSIEKSAAFYIDKKILIKNILEKSFKIQMSRIETLKRANNQI